MGIQLTFASESWKKWFMREQNWQQGGGPCHPTEECKAQISPCKCRVDDLATVTCKSFEVLWSGTTVKVAAMCEKTE